MQSIIIGPNQAGQRFDKFLHKYMPQAQTSFLYKMLRKKNITLNGKKAEGKEMLQEGDEVKIFFADETLEKFTGIPVQQKEPVQKTGLSAKDVRASHVSQAPHASQTSAAKLQMNQYENAYKRLKGIKVIYEDANVLILDKPAGILTQKASDSDLSLNEWMIGYLIASESITPEELHSFKPSVCNRLDRNTSGLVLCGKSLAGSQALSRMIHDRKVRKFYRTIVNGAVTKETQIDGYLVKNEKNNKVQIFSASDTQLKEYPDADSIRTAYRPLEKGNHPAAGTLTYLEVELITGKTHQIRAHLGAAGHSLIGDYKYGKRNVNDIFKEKFGLSAQLLHAYRLEFPKTEGALSELSGKEILAPLPRQFSGILKECHLEES